MFFTPTLCTPVRKAYDKLSRYVAAVPGLEEAVLSAIPLRIALAMT